MRRVFALLVLLLFTLETGCSFNQGINVDNDYKTDLRDGTYTITNQHYDSRGYLKSLAIGVHSGLITEINYAETNREGINRLNVPSALHWEKCDYSFAQIEAQLYQEAIISQGKHIDTISGATRTCSDFKQMLDLLLEASKNGGPENSQTDSVYDTYTVANAPDPFSGSQEQMTAVFSYGRLVDVEVKEVTNNAAFYTIGRSYSNLADISKKAKSLDPLDVPNVDPNILLRYNELLEQVKQMRDP